MKITKNYLEKEQKINIENYLKKKKIKREHGRNRYHNMSEEKKKRLKEYQKIYREAKKNCYREDIFVCFVY